MLSSAYMCVEQLELFRILLAAEKSVLLKNARKILDHMQELDAVPDLNDRASVEKEYLL